MIIKSEMTALTIPYNKPFRRIFGGSHPLKDMRDLFGGKISKLEKGERDLGIPAGDIVDYVHQKELAATIEYLENPVSARTWTTIQAYRAKRGLTLGRLAVEVPGLTGHQEWEGRRLKEMAAESERQRDTYQPK